MLWKAEGIHHLIKDKNNLRLHGYARIQARQKQHSQLVRMPQNESQSMHAQLGNISKHQKKTWGLPPAP